MESELAKRPFRVFTDDEISDLLRPEDAIAWMREALLAEREGRLISPARVSAMLDSGKLILTAGSMAGAAYGYRVYDTMGLPGSEQIVVAHDPQNGAVLAIAVGSEVGLRRTAAIGGVAHDVLAPRCPVTVAIIGAGNQAKGQLWALQAVREVAGVKLFSRDPARRDAVAKSLDDTYAFPVHGASSARDAVEAADVVVLATNSGVPVIRTEWLRRDAYVATLGPKQIGRSEYDEELLRAADIIVTDSITQLNGYHPPAVAAQSGIDIGSLADLIASPPESAGLRVYLSVGLSGTEPYLLHRLALHAETLGR